MSISSPRDFDPGGPTPTGIGEVFVGWPNHPADPDALGAEAPFTFPGRILDAFDPSASRLLQRSCFSTPTTFFSFQHN
jgi:hypothetical protein